MSDEKLSAAATWTRIPDGTKVRLSQEAAGQVGTVDGLTQMVMGQRRNPDGLTQYRINVGEPTRLLAVEDELWILTDPQGLVLIEREQAPYRTQLTARLHGVFPADRFIATETSQPATRAPRKSKAVKEVEEPA